MTTSLSEHAQPADCSVSAVAATGVLAAQPPLLLEQVHTAIWALAEAHFRQARQQYRARTAADAQTRSWRTSVLAGLSCLYSVVHMCTRPAAQIVHFGGSLVMGADTEAKTRLRIAQVLAEWGEQRSRSNNSRDNDNDDDEEEDEEALQLHRALLCVPNADAYTETRYAIILAQCRLHLRRGERGRVEQRLRSAYIDAQQRRQFRWAQLFMLELSNAHSAGGDSRAALDALQIATKQAQLAGDVVDSAVMAVQQLGRQVQARSWAAADALAASLAPLAADPALGSTPQLWARYWTLRAAAGVAQGRIGEAQEACEAARRSLQAWQLAFAGQLAAGAAADGGASFEVAASGLVVHGWSYYEAHVWVMLVSASALRGDDHYERASGFLRLALEGIARGEADGAGAQLRPLKINVLLFIADVNLAALYIGEAKKVLDRAMEVLADAEHEGQTALWRSSRDAIVLRWAMYKHRVGDFAEAIEAYQCVARRGADDVRFAARINLAVLHLSQPAPAETELALVRGLLGALEKDAAAAPCGDREKIRTALLEFVRGMESQEPVRAKAHLLSCLRLCNEAADTALQGWTLCLLGTMVLPTGQYAQAMKMCAAGQSIAQRANDPLQNAAAIGILARIEQAIGDPGRCAQLLQVDEQLLRQFNAQTQDH
ncbi:hypothetical protein H4R21_001199 [Coemansia helicoidea]|uniref:Uncharacterized protein n=1 Tax=Coemansia helicoidea TaxID=1286919 RepID=A0ACC1LD37_9FUNG|nr:hypothetical protein H4R21_001199 [Coemansia helicoidea]